MLMNEARVKFLERLFNDYSGDNADWIMSAHAAGIELIAALRDAWRERDAQEKQRLMAVESSRDYYNQRNIACEEISKQRERADRAEAEVKRLEQLLHDPRNDPEDEGAILKEMRKLWAVREAAEGALNALNQIEELQKKHGYRTYLKLEVDPVRANLRRALDACAKDPAR